MKNRSMPSGAIIPELAYPEVRAAVEWLCRCFGFTERLRIGDHRCQLSFGGGAIIVIGPLPAQPVNGDHAIMVQLDDVDQHYEQAKRQGARIVSAPADFPYGERQYTAEDPAGRRWIFSQTIADIDPASWGGVLLE